MSGLPKRTSSEKLRSLQNPSNFDISRVSMCYITHAERKGLTLDTNKSVRNRPERVGSVYPDSRLDDQNFSDVKSRPGPNPPDLANQKVSGTAQMGSVA